MIEARTAPYPFASLSAAMIRRGWPGETEVEAAFRLRRRGRLAEDAKFFAGAWLGAFVFFLAFIG